MLLMTSSQRRRWHPTPVLLPGKSHGRRSLVGCSPWGREESDMTEWLHFHLSLPCIGEGNGNLLQCPCLENPRDGGAWWAAIYGVAQSRTRLKGLSSSSMTSSDVSFIHIFLFLVMLGLRCYTWAFSGYGDEGSSLLRCVGHCGGCSCGGVLALGVQALVVVVLLGMWNLPRLGIEPVSRVLQGRCLSTVPPGKPPSVLFEDALDKLQISSLQAPGIHLIKHLDSYDWFDSFVAQSQICGPSAVTAWIPVVDICDVALSLVPFYCLFLFALIYLSLLFQLCCMIFILSKIHFKMRQGLNGYLYHSYGISWANINKKIPLEILPKVWMIMGENFKCFNYLW